MRYLPGLVVPVALALVLGGCSAAPGGEAADAAQESAGAPAPACDRACLEGALDAYLAALVAHDASLAPLAPTFRYTENALEVSPGDGLWATASALGRVQRRYFDPENGQAVFFGHIEETSGEGVAMLRIRVEDGAITEGESVVGRPSDGTFDADGLVAAPPPLEPVAADLLSTREAMIAAADSYFTGLETQSRETVRFVPGCIRIENGMRITGMRPGPDGELVDRGDCAQIGGMSQIAGVVNRRYPVVDEEAGVVIGMGVFNRPEGAMRADGTLWPRNLLTEVFLIEDGRINGIWAAMHYMTPDVPSAPGW